MFKVCRNLSFNDIIKFFIDKISSLFNINQWNLKNNSNFIICCDAFHLSYRYTYTGTLCTLTAFSNVYMRGSVMNYITIQDIF